jgi:hypothetical protein
VKWLLNPLVRLVLLRPVPSVTVIVGDLGAARATVAAERAMTETSAAVILLFDMELLLSVRLRKRAGDALEKRSSGLAALTSETPA